MSNSFYTHGAFPSTGSAATSASMRAELDLISAGFDKMPTLSGNANLFVVINSTGTGLTQTSTLPSATFTDTLFTIQDDGDNTRKFQFNASTVTPGATRIYSVPDANTTLVGTGTTQTLTNKTLTAPVISSIVNTGTLTLPTSTDTLVGRATTDTLTNKTLTSPAIATIVNTGTLTLPTSTDTLVGRATTDTLTNKTLTSPVIATIVNTGTLTLPTSTDTLVGRATTDTLTNKTLTSPVIATIVNTGTLTLPTSTDTLVGRATTDTLTNKTLTSPVIATIVNTGTLTLPTSTDTLVGRATTDTLTNKTLGAFTISGTVSGGGNQINNVIIGASTPLAGSFTTLSTTGLASLPSTGRSAAAALTVTNPAFLYGVASTYTDTASSGTIAAMAPFYSISGPTLSTSNVTTYTNSATLYIANAPTAGGSATITNPYSIYVAAGAAYFGGAVTATGAITLNTTTNNQSYTTTGAGTITISSGTAGSINNMTIGGTTAAAGTFTNLTYTGTLTGSTGVIAIGTNQIYKDASGNVGIGTSSPGYKLDVQGATASTQLKSTTGTNYVAHFLNNTGGFTYLGVESSAGGSLFTGTAAYEAVFGTVSAYPVGFATGGAERMRIDTSGNVGIGTASGSARLNVNGGTSTSQIRWEVNNAAFTQEVSTNAAANAYVYKTNDALYHVWKLSSAEAMRIDSSGNVGIGTSSPAGKLEVSGGRSWFTANSELYSIALRYSSSTGVMYMGATNSVSTPSIQFSNSGGTALATIDYSGNVGIGTSLPNLSSSSTALTVNTGTAANYSAFELASGGTLNYHINANNSAVYHVAAGTRPWVVYTNGSERMRIDSSGNVGIGTSSSAARLGVVNDQAALSYLFDTSNVTNGGGSLWRMITRNIANTGTTSVDFYKPSGTGFSIINNDTNASNFTAFNVGSTERMRIDSSGNVLVTNPAGLGYGTGSGGTVTQATSKSTAVTLNKPTGKITTTADALASNTTVAFTFNNSLIAATDNVVFTFADGNGYQYLVWAYNMLAGSCTVALRNITAGSLSQALPINFAIIKGATA